MPSVGTVVPAYRPDEDRLVAYVEALVAALDPAVVRIELDDPDGRVGLDGLPARATVNAVARRRGKGAAVTAGFEALSTDVYAFADADGSTPADSMADVVRPVVDGAAALAVGSRRHPDAEVLGHQTFARRLLGDGFAWLARRLLEPALYDYQCGAKALDAETWAAVREGLHEAGFAWDIELIALAGALDRRVVEVPVRWEDAPGSTVEPVSTSLALLRGLVRARHRARRLRGDGLQADVAGRLADRGRPALVDRPGVEVEADE
jgi:glycosyltransferase involved in cell wall biosynthesis